MMRSKRLAAMASLAAAGALLSSCNRDDPSGGKDPAAGLATRGHAPASVAGPHLFVDDKEIASTSGIQRVITPPAKRPTPIIDGKRDHNYQPYTTVLRENGVYRLWYGAKVSELQAEPRLWHLP